MARGCQLQLQPAEKVEILRPPVARKAANPVPPAFLAWQLVEYFLERRHWLCIQCRTPDIPTGTNQVEGRFDQLKPYVSMTESFRTVTGMRNFLCVVSHVYVWPFGSGTGPLRLTTAREQPETQPDACNPATAGRQLDTGDTATVGIQISA